VELSVNEILVATRAAVPPPTECAAVVLRASTDDALAMHDHAARKHVVAGEALRS
jgi:hypothetical protein